MIGLLEKALWLKLCPIVGVAPSTIEAIIQHESSFNPLAININGPSGGPQNIGTAAEAVKLAQELMQRQVNFDAGLMQINSANFKAYSLTAESVFQPCQNIRVGSQILQKFYLQAEKDFGPGQKALQAALSAYNTGDSYRGFTNGYVQKYYPSMSFPARLPGEKDGSTKTYKALDPYSSSMIAIPDFKNDNSLIQAEEETSSAASHQQGGGT